MLNLNEIMGKHLFWTDSSTLFCFYVLFNYNKKQCSKSERTREQSSVPKKEEDLEINHKYV